MHSTLDWYEIAIRLLLTLLAGGLVGLNRTEHGRPAGLRTTMLVCLAASISMIQANLLMNTNGKPSDSFITLDLMRLPLGILTGVGFIGAGAILRKDDIVFGITTAATVYVLVEDNSLLPYRPGRRTCRPVVSEMDGATHPRRSSGDAGRYDNDRWTD
jgi:putative Mg2+ transporter-C (MgtC) family protein